MPGARRGCTTDGRSLRQMTEHYYKTIWSLIKRAVDAFLPANSAAISAFNDGPLCTDRPGHHQPRRKPFHSRRPLFFLFLTAFCRASSRLVLYFCNYRARAFAALIDRSDYQPLGREYGRTYDGGWRRRKKEGKKKENIIYVGTVCWHLRDSASFLN